MDGVSSQYLTLRALPLEDVREWSQHINFQIDAFGLVTLEAEEVNLAVGTLQRRRYTDFLPLLAAFVIAGNCFTIEQPKFVLYTLSDGITSTELKGWFTRWHTRWLMSQESNNTSAALIIFGASSNPDQPAFVLHSRSEGITPLDDTDWLNWPLMNWQRYEALKLLEWAQNKIPGRSSDNALCHPSGTSRQCPNLIWYIKLCRLAHSDLGNNTTITRDVDLLFTTRVISTKHDCIPCMSQCVHVRRYNKTSWRWLAWLFLTMALVTPSTAAPMPNIVGSGFRNPQMTSQRAKSENDMEAALILLVLFAFLEAGYVCKLLRTAECPPTYTPFHRATVTIFSILFFALVMSGEHMSHCEWMLLFQLTIFTTINFTWDLYLSLSSPPVVKRLFLWTVGGMYYITLLVLGLLRGFWDDKTNPKHAYKGLLSPSFMLTNLVSFSLYNYFNYTTKKNATTSDEALAEDGHAGSRFHLSPYRTFSENSQDDAPASASFIAVEGSPTLVAAPEPNRAQPTNLDQSISSGGHESTHADVSTGRGADEHIEHRISSAPATDDDIYRLASDDESESIDGGPTETGKCDIPHSMPDAL